MTPTIIIYNFQRTINIYVLQQLLRDNTKRTPTREQPNADGEKQVHFSPKFTDACVWHARRYVGWLVVNVISRMNFGLGVQYV